MSTAVLKQIISQQEQESLKILEKRWAERTTNLEWKDVLDSISDFKKSHSDLMASTRIRKILKESTDIQTFYYVMVYLTPVEDRKGRTIMTIPAPPPLTKLDPNIILPQYLNQKNQESLRRLPFERGSTLKQEDVLSILQELRNIVGPVDAIVGRLLQRSKTMDIFHASVCVRIMKVTKPFSVYSRMETSIYPFVQVTLRDDLFFPDFLSNSDKVRLQVLFSQKDTDLKWDHVISTISDLRKITGTNDSYLSLYLIESETIEAFHKRMVAHILNSKLKNLLFKIYQKSS